MFGIPKNKSIMNIRTYGDPCLKRKSAPVGKMDHEKIKLAEALVRTMYADDGVGLAAPQVGVNTRIISLGVPMPKPSDTRALPMSPGERMLLPRMPLVFINPKIISFSPVTEVAEEGCLSVPGIYAPVQRPVSVVVEADILSAEHIKIECAGLLARAFQHEIDHLDGVLFVDRLNDEFTSKVAGRLERLKKQGRKRGFVKRITV
jgi:peptide deformylase